MLLYIVLVAWFISALIIGFVIGPFLKQAARTQFGPI